MWQIIINGPRYFETTLFLPPGVTALGRAPENDIVLDGTLVSRHHAQFDVRGDDLYVIDLGSRNGLQVNGRRLEGTALLRPGDLVLLGEHTLTVRQPAKVENISAPMVDVCAGGVRRLGLDVLPTPPPLAECPTGHSRFIAALEDLAPSEERRGDTLPRGYRTLILLGESAEKVHSTATLQAFLEEVSGWTRAHLKAESAILLLEHFSGVMVPVAVKQKDGITQGEVPVSDGLLASAVKQRKALAADLSPLSPGSGKSRALCAPFRGKDGLGGALYLNLGSSKSDPFELLEVADALAQLVAGAVARFTALDKSAREERLRKTLERFHGPDILEKRVKELTRQGAKPTGLEQQQITVLVADLSGFTPLSEALAPARVEEILNEFYDRMTQVLFSFEGTIDKFMGDSVLALFGAPYSRSDDAMRAVRCAFALREEWKKAMNRRPPEEKCLLQIGLSTGRALVGTVGSAARLDFTAIGEPVNLASWACSASPPGEITVTQSTLDAIGPRFERRELGEKTVRKMRRRVPMFELAEEAPLDITESGRPLRAK